MANQCRVIGAKVKAKLALAAIREQNIARELSIQLKVHQTQIGARKKKLNDEAPSIFERDYIDSRSNSPATIPTVVSARVSTGRFDFCGGLA